MSSRPFVVPGCRGSNRTFSARKHSLQRTRAWWRRRIAFHWSTPGGAAHLAFASIYGTGTEDYFIIHYSNLALNLKLPGSKFKQDWPNDVHRIKPQG